MLYHRFSNIRDNGGVLEDADSYDDGEYAYARKIFRHSITVDFGGESYDVEAVITLRRNLGPASEPYILRSEVVDKSLEPMPSGDGYLSSITVKSAMSTGEDVTETYTAEIAAGLQSEYVGGVEVPCRFDDFAFQNATLEMISGGHEANDGYVNPYRIEEKCVLHYNHADLEIGVYRYTAIFDNGVIREEMNTLEFDAENIKVSEDWRYESSSGDQDYYYGDITIDIPFGELTITGIYSATFVFDK